MSRNDAYVAPSQVLNSAQHYGAAQVVTLDLTTVHAEWTEDSKQLTLQIPSVDVTGLVDRMHDLVKESFPDEDKDEQARITDTMLDKLYRLSTERAVMRLIKRG